MGNSLRRCTFVWLLVGTVSVPPLPLWGQATDGPDRFELLGEGPAIAGIDWRADDRIAPLPQERPARGRGALWGGGIGLVAGGLLGGLIVSSEESDDGIGGSLAESAATSEAVILGALLGAGIGALLGATFFAPSRSSVVSRAGDTLSVVPVAAIDRFGTVVRISW